MDDLNGNGNEVWDNVWNGELSTIGGKYTELNPTLYQMRPMPINLDHCTMQGMFQHKFLLERLKSVLGLRVEKFDQCIQENF